MPRGYRAPRTPWHEQHAIDNNPQRRAEEAPTVNVQNGETVQIEVPPLIYDEIGNVPNVQTLSNIASRLSTAGASAAEATSSFSSILDQYTHTFTAPTRFRDFVSNRYDRTDATAVVYGTGPGEGWSRSQEALEEAGRKAREKSLDLLSAWVSSTFFADPLMVREALDGDTLLLGLVQVMKLDYERYAKNRALPEVPGEGGQ